TRLFALWSCFWAVVLGLVVGCTMVLPFAVLPRGRRERYTIRGAAVWAWLCIRGVLLCRPRITGTIDLPPGQGAILVCNHRSWLDPMLLIAYGLSNGLSKREILYIPVIGLFGHLSGAVFFDRRDRGHRAWARKEVLKLVKGGHRLQVFPEGTRSKDGNLRRKVFLTLPRDAWNDGIPVVPCAVSHTEDVLPVGRFAAYPGKEVGVVFGATLWPKDFASEEDFAVACWKAVKDLLKDAA
ncbi:MAG: 1-acyl-sn-glycerol-3-phosphate acyltransferase, partial [Myxococcales bacterium]|nr:1-acyl-sn-glycerol-3-phosphate acyltransferase [Myxococcales bacterium]